MLKIVRREYSPTWFGVVRELDKYGTFDIFNFRGRTKRMNLLLWALKYGHKFREKYGNF